MKPILFTSNLLSISTFHGISEASCTVKPFRPRAALVLSMRTADMKNVSTWIIPAGMSYCFNAPVKRSVRSRRRHWIGERLTLIHFNPIAPMSCSWRNAHAFLKTMSPIPSISPFFSATGINRSGRRMPLSTHRATPYAFRTVHHRFVIFQTQRQCYEYINTFRSVSCAVCIFLYAIYRHIKLLFYVCAIHPSCQ